jgi:uncharacterized protein (TIGR03435 family)
LEFRALSEKENPMMVQTARGCRTALLLLVGTLVAAGLAAMGQATAGPAAKAQTFDVVSIKPNNSGTVHGAWGVSQNKYFARATPLGPIILQAYLGEWASAQERLKGAPSWVLTEPYDLTAKVDDATASSWQGMRQAQQVAIAAPMLRTMLEDRCKLVVHTVPTEVSGYALVVGKHGMKMKEARAGEPVPAHAVRFDGGGMMVPIMPGPDAKQSLTYLQITMAQLAEFLSAGGQRQPVVDQTGLKGRYDFELPLLLDTSTPEGREGATPAPGLDSAHMFDWKAIGLEMKPIKVPARDLVIDHIERPTAN